MTRTAPKPAYIALALAMLAAAYFTYARARGVSFYVDEWDFILHRRGHDFDTFLEPRNGHLIALPLLVYKFLFETVGVDSIVPFRLVAIAVSLTVGVLFFLLVRRRVGETVALLVTITVLFFGPGWEPLTASIGMVALISLAAGLGMLLALDARTPRGDVVAGILLAVSLASFSYGIAFAAAAAVDVLLRPGGARRLWLVAVPVALYGLWWLGWGEGESTWANVPGVPHSVADSLSADAVALAGLYRSGGAVGNSVSFDTTYGPPLAIALAAWVLYRLRGPLRESPRLWACVVLALFFWISVALVQDAGRPPQHSRFVYPGSVFVLLIGAELLKDVRFGRRALVGVAVWTGVLLIVGVPNLRGGGNALATLGRFNRAELAAIELARDNVRPDFKPEPGASPLVQGHYLENIEARSYLNAVDDFGSPAYSVSELRRAPPQPRAAADLVLVAAYGLAVLPEPTFAAGAPAPQAEPGGDVRAEPQGPCLLLSPRGDSPARAVLMLPAAGMLVRGDQAAPLELRLRRFGDTFEAALPAVPGRPLGRLAVPVDGAEDMPWHAQLSGIRAPVLVCGPS